MNMHKVHGRIMLTFEVHLQVKENRPITPDLTKAIKKLVSQELNLRIGDSSLVADLPLSNKKGISVDKISPEIKLSLD